MSSLTAAMASQFMVWFLSPLNLFLSWAFVTLVDLKYHSDPTTREIITISPEKGEELLIVSALDRVLGQLVPYECKFKHRSRNLTIGAAIPGSLIIR